MLGGKPLRIVSLVLLHSEHLTCRFVIISQNLQLLVALYFYKSGNLNHSVRASILIIRLNF